MVCIISYMFELNEKPIIESLDDGLKIVRTPAFNYGSDAVELARLFKAHKGVNAVDLCAGGGILAFLCAQQTGARFTAVELQGELCEALSASAALNEWVLGYRINVINADIRALEDVLPASSFEAAVCNPPYYDKACSPSENAVRDASRRQEECTVLDVARAAARLLKSGGDLFISYPAARMAEAIAALCGAGLEPKHIRFLRGTISKPPYLVLIQAKKGARVGATISEKVLSYGN